MKTYSGYIVEVKVNINGAQETLYYAQGEDDTCLRKVYLSSDINHAEIFGYNVSKQFLRNFTSVLKTYKQVLKLLDDGRVVEVRKDHIRSTKVIEVKREISTLEVK